MKNRLFFSLILVILLSVWMLGPQLTLPWMLIDDGENLRMGQEITNHFSAGDYTWILSYEKVNGRFRPAYWLWHFANFQAFGFNSFGHHFGHLILYTLIAILIFLIVQEISKSNLAGFLSVIFFFFFYPAAENYYRLGTAEPPLLLFYLSVVFLLVRVYFSKFRLKVPTLKKTDYFFLIIVLGIAYFMKETAPILILAFLSVLVIGLIDSKVKNKKAWLKFSAFFLLTNIFFFLLTYGIKRYYGIGGGYTEAYKPNLAETISRFFVYLRLILREYRWLLVVPLITFSLQIFNQFQKAERQVIKFITGLSSVVLWQILLVSWFLVFLAIQSPWIYVMGRYLPPVIVWLAIFLAIEYARVFSFKDKLSLKFSEYGFSFKIPILKLLALLLIFGLVVSHGKRIRLMYQGALQNERYTHNLIKYLAEKVPPEGSVYANFSEGIMEYLYELPLHFRFFYSRSDIVVDYLFLDKQNTFKKGDFIIAFKKDVWRYDWEEVKETFAETKEIDLYEFGPHWSVLVFEAEEFFDNIKAEEG